MHHVAVGDHVVLALESHLSGFLVAGLTIVGDVVAIANRLGADEAIFEVGVDNAGGALVPSVIVQARVSFGPAVK